MGKENLPTAIIALAALIAAALDSFTELIPEPAASRVGTGCFCDAIGVVVGRIPMPTPLVRRDVCGFVAEIVDAVDVVDVVVCWGGLGPRSPPDGGAGGRPEGNGGGTGLGFDV